MKRTIWAMIAMVVLFTSLSFAQGDKKAAAKPMASGGGTEQALMDIEKKWAAASLKNDTAALDGILADHWTGINSQGKTQNKADSMGDMKKSKFTKSEVSGMKVHMMGADAAVVTGVWTGVGTGADGTKVDTSEAWTDVFMNHGGKWKCVASQSTTVKK